KSFQGFSGSLNPQLRLFNAMLDYLDESETTHPYLAESLPQLNTDTWRVSPDGAMETTYRLRPNLTWHDGTAFSADDFVFGWEVYSKPELGVANLLPFSAMEQATATDSRTLVIRWKRPYPDASSMDTNFQALPRHILSAALHETDALGFTNLPFWGSEYVGLGAYKLEHWEPGAFIEASAFDGFVLGRPKIERLKVLFIGDPNTVLASMLSGEGDFVTDFVLGVDEADALEREWAARGIPGTVFFAPVLLRITQMQHRPDYVKPRALLDVRVRHALAQAFDTPSVIDGLTGGRGVLTYSLSSPRVAYYLTVERSISKSEYDPRAAQRLLEQAGLTRGADGFFQGPGGEPFQFDLWNDGGAYEKENRVYVDGLRRAGIDVSPQTLGRLQDEQFRALLPALFTGGSSPDRFTYLSRGAIPTPENRWQGTNRGGWENLDYDRFYQAFKSTLDRDQRIQQIAQMEKALTEDVGAIPHYFTLVPTAAGPGLRGPRMRQTPDAVAGQSNISSWEWSTAPSGAATGPNQENSNSRGR
ncbi:MAG TPA: ABC transporter substrate-binding protein, partial [Chloroflexota bacterium]